MVTIRIQTLWLLARNSVSSDGPVRLLNVVSSSPSNRALTLSAWFLFSLAYIVHSPFPLNSNSLLTLARAQFTRAFLFLPYLALLASLPPPPAY